VTPWFVWLVAPLTLVTLGPALCYPAGWDELVYHSVLPQRWLADGWPAFYADIPYSGFPSLGEILFWLVAPIERVIAPRLIVWVCWLIGLVFLYRLLRRRLAANSAGVLMLAFALCETVLLISANCYVESILMLNVAAMLLVIESRAIQPGWRQAIILGVIAGGSAAVKLTGVAIIIVPLLWQLGRNVLDRRATAWQVSAYLLVAALVALPFYLRPWLLTGNPFYPYYAEWFTSDQARLEMSRYHQAIGAAFGVHHPAALVIAPLLVTIESNLYDGGFGWQLLIFIGLAVLALRSWRSARWRPFVVGPAVACGWLYAFWFRTAQQARFAVPTVMVLVLLAAIGLHSLRGKWRRMLLAGLLVAAAVSAPWRTAGHYVGSWLAALRVISWADYVNESTDHTYPPLVRAIDEKTPADARLMLLFEHRGFYLPRPYTIATPFFQESGFTPPESFRDSTKIMEVLARERITHVVLAEQVVGPDHPPVYVERLEPFIAALRECIQQGQLRVIWAEPERYVLLEVQPQ
jgi:hypothetical protein